MTALVLVGLLASSGGVTPFKCGGLPNTFPGYEPPTPVLIVDDRVMSGPDPMEEFRTLDVAYVTMSCWNPETGEFASPPGIPLVRAVTKAEFRDLITPAATAVRSQAAAHRETGEYLTVADDLGLETSPGVEFQLESDGSSWRLIILSRFQRCEVSSELAEEVTKEFLEFNACGFRPEEQSAALRRAYEAGS